MPTERELAKQRRRHELLSQAAAIMAEKGFHQTRLSDVGAAVGISGPAIYRHFSSKEELLGEILLDISVRLVDGARAAFARHDNDGDGDGDDDPLAVLEELFDLHVTITVDEADLVRVQEREIEHLEEEVRGQVKSLQRTYLGLWADAVQRAHPEMDRATARLRVQMIAGMMGSAHYVLHWVDHDLLKQELKTMGMAALFVHTLPHM